AAPLTIKCSLSYRQTNMKCNAESYTFLFALHLLADNHMFSVCRALYVWLAVILTTMPLRVIRSKGKWKASYMFVFSASVILLVAVCTANVPLFRTIFIAQVPIGFVC
ncbi:hypothetical protein PENTCL1PPCAC_16173, partial [Pristionchus entomophagus]